MAKLLMISDFQTPTPSSRPQLVVLIKLIFKFLTEGYILNRGVETVR